MSDHSYAYTIPTSRGIQIVTPPMGRVGQRSPLVGRQPLSPAVRSQLSQLELQIQEIYREFPRERL